MAMVLCECDNQRAYAFYLQRDFAPRDEALHVYTALRPDVLPQQNAACRAGVGADRGGLIALHEKLFPSTYATGARMTAATGKRERLWVVGDVGDVHGYVYATLPEDGEEGYVDFLGVREDKRRQGTGRVLLDSALHWLFGECGMTVVHLTVDDGRHNARALYERAEFCLKYTGISARRDW